VTPFDLTRLAATGARRQALVVVVGAGFVGVTTAILLDRLGFRVALVEADPTRVDTLSIGVVPFYEPGISEAWREASTRVAVLQGATAAASSAYRDAWATFICVGTPKAEDGSQDSRAVFEVASEWAGAQGEDPGSWGYLAIRSTVLPYVPKLAWSVVDEARPAGSAPWHRLCHVPEFLAEGTALEDSLAPVRSVAGWVYPEALAKGEGLAFLKAITPGSPPLLSTTAETASLVKYGSNVMLASRLSTLQDLARISGCVGADISVVSAALAQDSRIGGDFLAAGAGWGGSCFPKDVAALESFATRSSLDVPALTATLASNKHAIAWTAENAHRGVVARYFGMERRRPIRVAWLGIAFKAGTSDTRESPSLASLRRFLAGCERDSLPLDVRVYDPRAKVSVDGTRALASVEDAVRGADVVVYGTAWRDFTLHGLGSVLPLLAKSPRVIDARGVFDPKPEDLPDGAVFVAFGRPIVRA